MEYYDTDDYYDEPDPYEDEPCMCFYCRADRNAVNATKEEKKMTTTYQDVNVFQARIFDDKNNVVWTSDVAQNKDILRSYLGDKILSMQDSNRQDVYTNDPKNMSGNLPSIRWDIQTIPLRLEVEVPAVETPKELVEGNLYLTGFGRNKISAIKAVREITSLGLKDAKELVEAAFPTNPQMLNGSGGWNRLDYAEKLEEAGIPKANILIATNNELKMYFI